MLAKSSKNLFFLIVVWRESQFSLRDQNYVRLKSNFSPSWMQKFTLKAGSIFLFDAFQFILVEKCNTQFFLYNLTRTSTYIIEWLVISRACSDVAMLDSEPHKSLFKSLLSHLAY